MTDKNTSIIITNDQKFSLNLIETIFPYMGLKSMFELHLVSSRINQKYWEYLSKSVLQLDYEISTIHPGSETLSNLSSEVLLSIVKASKDHKILNILASECITLLNSRNYNFANLDLTGIQISGADFSLGIFENVNFSCSKLNNINFTRSYLSGCNFDKADMTNSYFCMNSVTGHLQSITSICLSSDRKLLASGGYDTLIKLWEIPSLDLIKTLKGGHSTMISSIWISNDSSILISSAENIRIWDLKDYTSKAIVGHKDKITGISMCSGNGIFVSCSLDSTIKLWKTETSKCKLSISLDVPVLSVMLSPDGKNIIAGTNNGTLALWDRKGSLISSTKYNKSPIKTVFIDKKFIVSGSYDGKLILRTKENDFIREYTGHSDCVMCVKIYMRYIFSCGSTGDSTIRKWDLDSNTCLDVISGYFDGINTIAVLPNAVISAGKDKVIRINDTVDKPVIVDWIECIEIADDGCTVIVGYKQGVVRFWRDNKCVDSWNLASRIMSLSSCKQNLAAGCWNMKVYVRGEMDACLIGHTDGVNSIQLTDNYLFSGGCDGLVIIWAWKDGYRINTLSVNSGYVHKVMANEKYLVSTSGCSNAKITIWDLENDTHENFYHHRGRVKALAMGSTKFVTGGSDSIIELWSYQGHRMSSLKAHSGAIIELVFYTENLLISSAEDKIICLWDTNTYSIVSKTFGFTASRIFHGQGKIFACESKNNFIQFFECYCGDNTLSTLLLWRTSFMLECKNCSFNDTKGITKQQLSVLQNVI
jgi:WD40 repeat protein